MKMHQLGKRIIAAVLCCSVMLAGTACKKTSKTDKKGRVVKESDTFFESEVSELKLPVDETKEIEFLNIDTVDYQGDRVQVSYSVLYKAPSGSAPGGILEGEDRNEYFFSGNAVFDLKGELISYGKNTENENQEVSAMTTDAEGNIVQFVRIFGADEGKECKIVFLNRAGETVKEVVPETPWNPNERIISKIRVLPDGKIILQEADSSFSPAYVFDENGKYLFVLSSMDLGLMSDICMKNGKYYAMTMPSDITSDSYQCLISEIDMTNGQILKGKELSEGIQPDTVVVTGDGMYVTSPQRISKIDVETGKLEEIFDWNQTDVDRGILDRISSYPKSENEIYVISQSGIDSFLEQKAYLIHLNRAEKNPHAGKKILYMGGMWISSDLYKYVNRYNSDPSHTARIETIDYLYDKGGAVTDDESLENKKRELILNILSGDAPDILLDFAGMDNLASEDVLVDINQYIDGGNGLPREEYFDNLFRAMETNGKLFFAPLTFRLDGFFVNSELMDVPQNWTFDDLDRAAESLPEDTMLMPQKDCKDLLTLFMGADQSEFTDYQKKQVHFSCDSMKRILEETKKYGNKEGNSPKAILPQATLGSTSYHGIQGLDQDGLTIYSNAVDLGVLLYSGKCAMMARSIGSFTDYNFCKKVCDKKGKFVGYPTVDGKGLTAAATLSLSILASSDYKDEAWEIIKSFYTEEGQTALLGPEGIDGYGFPMKKNVFDKMGSDSVALINETYEYALKDTSMGSSYHVIYFRADEGLDQELRTLVENVRYAWHVNMSATAIIQEEAEGYFQDSRSAEDVLKNIDNRASQLVQEQ